MPASSPPAPPAAEMNELPAEAMAAIMEMAATMGPVGAYFLPPLFRPVHVQRHHPPPKLYLDGKLDLMVVTNRYT